MKSIFKDGMVGDAADAMFYAEVERIAAMSREEVERDLRGLGVEPVRALPERLVELLAKSRGRTRSTAASVFTGLAYAAGILLIFLGIAISIDRKISPEKPRAQIEVPNPGAYRKDNTEELADIICEGRRPESETDSADYGSPAAVPEPTTMILLGFGLAGLAARRRRRRKTT